MQDTVQNEVEADKETDIRVAREVMGWQQWNHESGDWEGNPDITYFADFNTTYGLAVYTNGDADPSWYFEPSNAIAHAWAVVEKMRQQYPPFVLWCQGDYFIAQIWDKDEKEIANEKADTAPLAICRAALKVVEKLSSK